MTIIPLVVRAWRRLRHVTFYNMKYVRARVATRGSRGSVTCWPARPHPYSTLYQACKLLGVRVSNRVLSDTRTVFYWTPLTRRVRFDPPFERQLTFCVLNECCVDVSKRTLDLHHQTVFGYNLIIDPTTFSGMAACKSDENALHNYYTVTCPIVKCESGKVYQRLINNVQTSGLVCDIRAVIVGKTIVHCYYKYRPVDRRYDNENTLAKMVSVEESLSASEQSLVLDLCARMGMNFGEVDILRDNDDGRIYVVDLNPTPLGPPNHLEGDHVAPAMRAIADSLLTLVTR